MDAFIKEWTFVNLVAMSGGKRLEGKLDEIEQAVIRAEQNVVEVPPTVIAEMEDGDAR